MNSRKLRTVVLLAAVILVAALVAGVLFPVGPARWRHLARAIKVAVLIYRLPHHS